MGVGSALGALTKMTQAGGGFDWRVAGPAGVSSLERNSPSPNLEEECKGIMVMCMFTSVTRGCER